MKEKKRHWSSNGAFGLLVLQTFSDPAYAANAKMAVIPVKLMMCGQ